MNAISRRSLLARGSLLLAAGTAPANTPVHARAAKPQGRSGNFKPIDMAMEQGRIDPEDDAPNIWCDDCSPCCPP
ncbi:hypothetical protein [Pararhizobium sp. PWRC1-1]|uniref:hypothetical protein n=1 Tax=Pararhizobium sp. PWRC1-1 TaxID=2804566 RepID=UPI003CE85FA5